MSKRNTRSQLILKSKITNNIDDAIENDVAKTITELQHKPEVMTKSKARMLIHTPPTSIPSSSPKKQVQVKDKGKKVVESSASGTKRKRGSGELVNKVAVNPKDKFASLGSRMSPSSLYYAIKCLSTKQRIMVKNMGFGAFLDISIDTLPGKLSYYLVENFLPHECAIRTKSGEIKITKQTVKDMFGLPSEGTAFENLAECDKNDAILTQWKHQYEDCKYNNGRYLEKIRQSSTADEMFKLNFLTLFINTFCETEMMGSCKISFLEKLVNCENISKIDWCKYILDCLVKTKSKWKSANSDCKYVGPQTLLLLAYLDKVVCDDIKIRRVRPFIRAVDGEHLRLLEKFEMERGQFGSLKIRKEEGLREGIFASIDILMEQIVEKKQELKFAIDDGLKRYPESDELKDYNKKICELFTCGIAGYTENSSMSSFELNISQDPTPFEAVRSEVDKKKTFDHKGEGKQQTSNSTDSDYVVGKEKAKRKNIIGPNLRPPFVNVKYQVSAEEVNMVNTLIAYDKNEKLVCMDITEGQEDMHIPATNTIDDATITGFTYTKCNQVLSDLKLPPNASGCECKGNCTNPKTCACARLNGSEFPYVRSNGGRLIEAKDVVFECGPNCGCGPTCINRISQRGIKYQLEVFRTSNRGWAVKTKDFIPSGAPVCEFIGELRRTNDLINDAGNEYIFEIDCWQTMNEIGGRERRLGDVSESLSNELNKAADEKDKGEHEPEFCIDAGRLGNVARFINHSCEPNLFVQCVLSSHRDLNLARIVLFASDNIPPMQELTYDYGYALDSVVDNNGNVKKLACHCGTSECRKRLY